MNISSSASLQQALRAYQASEPQQAQAQVAVLKKAMDAQKSEAAELLKLLEGKGQQLDLRV
jgi:hypothetical protein